MKEVVEKLKKAKNVVVLSGAGISKASGIPTFRGKDGLWKNYDATQLATPSAFKKDPKLVWEWYNWRRNIIVKAKPNPAHTACVELEKMYKDGFSLITQNVDGLHRLAGSHFIYELHGNIWQTRCISCGKIEEGRKVYEENELPPKCKDCGGLLRPHIVWFGEMLPQDVLQEALSASRNADVVLSIGTSGVVQPAASIPLIAKENGAYVVELNVEKTPNSPFMDKVIIEDVTESLPQLIEMLKKSEEETS
jgi:NAD-dependent deacetylase